MISVRSSSRAAAVAAELPLGNAPSGTVKAVYRCLVAAALVWLVAVAGIAAAREYSAAGAVLVFGLLLYLLGALLTSNRYILCTALMASAALIAVDQADRVKYEYLQDHLNPYDLVMIARMIFRADFTVAKQYPHVFWPFVSFSGLGLGIIVAARRLEKLVVGDGGRTPGARRIAFCACLALLTIQLTIFLKSRYLAAASSLPSFLTAVEPGGLRIGTAAGFAIRMVRTWSELRSDARSAGPARGGSDGPDGTKVGVEDCSSCPDLVFVHLESTFDPVLLEEYSRTPGYLDRMTAQGERRSRSGPLLVNVYGGSSWISEFELLCGVHHTAFGDAGLYPHTFVAPYLKGCVPAYLKSLGYRTHAIYTTNPYFAGVAAGFRHYGIDTFLDNKAVGAPTDWREQRDIHFVDGLRRLLSEPSDQPRFVFVSTNSNHGPHGRDLGREDQPEPFDPSLAGNGETKDYISRLNETYSTMLRLERDLGRQGRPVAVLFYGDHQPAYRKTYAGTARQQFKRDISKITVFRMMRTYGDDPLQPLTRIVPARIEALAGTFLEFAGVPVSRQIRAAAALTQAFCPHRQSDCPVEVQRALRTSLMTDDFRQ
jgi:hypothetical protein